ncbi:TetR/AcrR family transcriptional regulator [uncultured Pseudoteredinibacter sp.]|uniref:TetR/AcrR family transcriptional regulator n=1 Tax=uncultured Pseudoteredinibacter sp. TaxID=1641701 RepID=UPI00260980CA|nr:TetR/AcrR family transcriptional regulator [uncultured Pseudoteredinibacter sp.]
MPRPQSVSNEHLLKAAMAQFWQFGYQGSGMQDLQQVTGLPASSIYSRFGSKAGLFEAALELYVDKIVRGRCDKYLSAEKGLLGIQQYVASALDDPNSHWGCLLVNSQAQISALPAASHSIMQRGGEMVCEALYKAIVKAEEMAEIHPGQNARLLAEQLAIFIQGILVQSGLAQTRPASDRVAAMIAQQLAAID